VNGLEDTLTAATPVIAAGAGGIPFAIWRLVRRIDRVADDIEELRRAIHELRTDQDNWNRERRRWMSDFWSPGRAGGPAGATSAPPGPPEP